MVHADGLGDSGCKKKPFFPFLGFVSFFFLFLLNIPYVPFPSASRAGVA
jgi:hypothetical protein